MTGGLGPVIDRSATTARDGRSAGYGNVWPTRVAAELLAFAILDGRAGKNRGVVFPRGNVEEPGARTERGRVPVRPALIPRPGRRPCRLRRLNRPPPFVEAAQPVGLHERFPH